MASLHEFLDVLADDPAKLTKFNTSAKDAKEVMDSEDVSATDQQLLETGSDGQIKKKLKDELTTKANAYVIRMTPQP